MNDNSSPNLLYAAALLVLIVMVWVMARAILHLPKPARRR